MKSNKTTTTLIVPTKQNDYSDQQTQFLIFLSK